MADQLSAIGQASVANGSAGSTVANAVRDAARETGVTFDYLYKVAVRESALDPRAEARTSSAAGLYQFIEQTWLAAVKKHGERHGMQAEAAAITEVGGRYRVDDPGTRAAILDMRFDARKSAALAGEFTRENRDRLEASLGRAVTSADLYAAHFLGAGGAETLLSAPPNAEAAALLPEAARANRPVFFDGDRPRSVAELRADFARSVDAGGPAPALREGPTPAQSFAWLTGASHLNAEGPAAQAGTDVAGRRTARIAPLPARSIEPETLTPLALIVLQSLDPLTSLEDERREKQSAGR